MLLYRICNKQEINLILNKGIEYVGSSREVTSVNSHNYKLGIPYIHFFLHKSDILYIGCSRDSYVCTYDIPYGLLDLYCGVGKYSDNVNFKDRVYVIEFAIPSKELKIDYLKRIDVLLDYIDYEDFLGGDILPELYETIYDSSKLFLRARKKEESSS